MGLTPAAVEVCLRAARQVLGERAERAERERLWSQRLECAARDADRVRRGHHLAEPENRLVVRHLEKEWETHWPSSSGSARTTNASPTTARTSSLRPSGSCITALAVDI
ncbi:hypothetical protein ACWD4G_44285 [Streptomyces sp. NPDC002643]